MIERIPAKTIFEYTLPYDEETAKQIRNAINNAQEKFLTDKLTNTEITVNTTDENNNSVQLIFRGINHKKNFSTLNINMPNEEYFLTSLEFITNPGKNIAHARYKFENQLQSLTQQQVAENAINKIDKLTKHKQT